MTESLRERNRSAPGRFPKNEKDKDNMKKLGIFLMSAIALGFTACDDYDEALPQFNPQQPTISVEGVEVAAGEQLAQPINLNTYEADSIEVIKTVKTPILN